MTRQRSIGLHLRAMGDQEADITKSVANMTKYCEMVIDPMRIRFCVEKLCIRLTTVVRSYLAGYSAECAGGDDRDGRSDRL